MFLPDVAGDFCENSPSGELDEFLETRKDPKRKQSWTIILDDLLQNPAEISEVFNYSSAMKLFSFWGKLYILLMWRGNFSHFCMLRPKRPVEYWDNRRPADRLLDIIKGF